MMYAKDGVSQSEKRQNASLAISFARRLGCSVFASEDDIVEVRKLSIMHFVASIMAHTLHVTTHQPVSNSSRTCVQQVVSFYARAV